MYMLLQANRKLKLGSMVILHVIDEDGGYRVEPHTVANLQSRIRTMFSNFKSKK